jgi:hypothetical protein
MRLLPPRSSRRPLAIHDLPPSVTRSMKPNFCFSWLRTFCILFAQCLLASQAAAGGDPSALLIGIRDLPPEAQIRILRVVLDEIGTPDELREQLARTCNERDTAKCAQPSKSPCAGTATATESSLKTRASAASREAMLSGLCAAPVRRQIEAMLQAEAAARDPARRQPTSSEQTKNSVEAKK